MHRFSLPSSNPNAEHVETHGGCTLAARVDRNRAIILIRGDPKTADTVIWKLPRLWRLRFQQYGTTEDGTACFGPFPLASLEERFDQARTVLSNLEFYNLAKLDLCTQDELDRNL
jgi:hypothetical protein